jgi:hypothetical protein
LSAAPLAVSADTAFLSYTLQDNTVLTGTFAGTLAGDLFTATSVLALDYNGFTYDPADFPTLVSLDSFLASSFADPILSLSGTYLDILVVGFDGFSFAVGNETATEILDDQYSGSGLFGATTETFVLANYSLEVVPASVPEPSTYAAVGMVTLALGSTWWRSRRKS